MYNVYFVNHDYFAQDNFNTFDDAVAYAKKSAFQCSIIKPYYSGKPNKGGERVGYYCPIGGLRDDRTL